MASDAQAQMPGPRRRPRRGSIERPVSVRMYRTAWAAIAVPLLVAAFTVGRPAALPEPELPATFDGAVAAQLARSFASEFPDRSPGSARAPEATEDVKRRLETYSLTVEEQRFTADLPGRGEVELVNLVARPLQVGPQRSPEAIVVMADRDNLGIGPGLDRNASGTAALIELARELSSLSVAHTILFVSTDGGAWGGLGAAHLASTPGFAGTVLAVVNLDAIGGPGTALIELGGGGGRSPASVLAATADASVFAETERSVRHVNGLYQLFDLGFPLALYSHAPLVEQGVSALTLTTAGSRPPDPAEDAPDRLSAERLGEIGRAAQQLVLSVDRAAEIASGTESYVYLGGRTVRGAALAFLLLVALLPFLVATADLYARLHRRGLALAPALRSLRSRLGVWLWGAALVVLFAITGVFPHGGGRPLPLDVPEAQNWPFAAIASLAALAGVGWLLVRVRLVPRGPVQRPDELAGHLAAMLLLCVVAVFLAIVETYALLFLLPSLHLWLWAPHARDAHPVARAILLLGGLAGPIALLAVLAVRLELGFDAPWYALTLFTTGAAPLLLAVALVLWGAAAGQVAAMLFGRYAPYPMEDERPVRGIFRETVRLVVLLARTRRRKRALSRGSDGVDRAASADRPGYQR